MTNDELKRYREQIERLKKDFHKDSPQNIENGSSENIEAPKKTPEISTTKPVEKNSFLEAIKNTDVKNELKKTPIDISNAKEKLKTVASNSISFENKEIKKPLAETKTVNTNVSNEKPIIKKEIPKPVINENKTIVKETKEIIPPIPPQNIPPEHDEEKKASILKFLIPIILILLIGAGIYWYMTKDNASKKEIAAQKAIEKAYADSILDYEAALLLETDNTNLTGDNIAISDTIFNIISNQEESYYAILGSYSELKNARILKRKNKTNFEAVIFDQSPIRVGLKLNEETVFEDLELVRQKYPSAWLIYNKN